MNYFCKYKLYLKIVLILTVIYVFQHLVPYREDGVIQLGRRVDESCRGL